MVTLHQTGKQAWIRKAHTLVMAGYAMISLTLAIVYIRLERPYYYLQSLGTLFILPLLWGIYRSLRMKPAYRIDIIIVCFTFLAYPIGVVLKANKTVPLYDKMLHTLSGTLSMMLSYLLFYQLKATHTADKNDFPLVVVFCLSVTIAVAGLWEIGEYFLSNLTGIDTQIVKKTGINDTMQDMIVCSLGSLFFLPFMHDAYEGKPARFLMIPVKEFLDKYRDGQEIDIKKIA